ncbi:MAG: OsmC family protein [Candidatus Thorarchaeota archaeon]
MSEVSHVYNVKVDWTHDRIGALLIEGKSKVQVATPPEFGGVDGILSPEDLFVAAAASCHMTTFVAFTSKMRFEFKSFSCEGVGTLEKVEKGFEFTKIVLKSTVTVGTEELRSKAERALALTGKYCLITNSMKCEVVHENHVIVE